MSSIDIEKLRGIIKNKNIEVHYQPLVSIIRKSIIGLEGLSRGILNGELIPPLDLFECAADSKERVSLDRLCREKVMENFEKYYQKNKELLLFVNIDGSAITEDILEEDFIVNLINKYNLKSENIVLEIVESKVIDNELLRKFIQNYRAYGFLIALDDVGSGNSNLDRISIAKPDIIKIDRAIVNDMHSDYYKQEVFKSLVSLSKNLGALVVAEGIECEEEAIKAIELGADLLQGYYFAKPEDIDPVQLKNYNVPVRKLANHYSKYLSEKISIQKKKHREYAEITKEVLEEISQYEERRFDFQLLEIINKYQVFECLYILDPSGIQVTDTITQFASFSKHKGLIFQPAKKGEDHSLKKYYFFLRNMKLSKYITEPYISLASGNLCITMSCVFKNVEGHKYILCIDLNPDYLYM
ncbi:EAL domain-containing protein [Clostridium sp. 19966]|uniref:EAL domain-containing protein n=1 Tax=Clostridium sp. 19966 TaxID=2768166 RepID=UPI0028E09B33|nr:EAL domain-containing protein [Clostridium sp. 19966]MDT8716326.1 EAL domain-containing protein [Clostridium sp. 19966]